MKKTLLFLAAIALANNCLAQFTQTTPDPLFYSGFENPTWTEQEFEGDINDPNYYYNPYAFGDLHNPDATTNYPSNWDEDLEDSYELGNMTNFIIKYVAGEDENGDPAKGTKLQRLGEITTDPVNSQNEVFVTWVKETYGYYPHANLYPARVETYINNPHKGMHDLDGSGWETLHYSIKFFLPESYEDLLEMYPNYELYPGGLTIIQFWNDAEKSTTVPGLRINIVIKKNATDSFFKFHVVAHELFADNSKAVLWSKPDLNTPIPLNQWNTLDVFFKEGDNGSGSIESAGRYRLKLNGVTVLDTVQWTHHPNDDKPDGVTLWNPFEMYTGRDLVDSLKAAGADRAEIYWDDFKIHGDSKLKQKYIKVVSPPNNSVITNSNATLLANWMPGTCATGDPNCGPVGLPYDWGYIFWIANRNDSSNIIYTPSQKTRHLDLTPYINSGQLRNNASYRVFTAIRNHPFIDKFGPWPDYHMDFTTDFGTGGGGGPNEEKGLAEDFMVFPNPIDDQFIVQFNVIDETTPTKIYILDKMGQKVLDIHNDFSKEGIQYKSLNATSTSMREDIYFCVFENGQKKVVKKIIVK